MHPQRLQYKYTYIKLLWYEKCLVSFFCTSLVHLHIRNVQIHYWIYRFHGLKWCHRFNGGFVKEMYKRMTLNTSLVFFRWQDCNKYTQRGYISLLYYFPHTQYNSERWSRDFLNNNFLSQFFPFSLQTLIFSVTICTCFSNRKLLCSISTVKETEYIIQTRCWSTHRHC
jgi:hypothetical protein